MPSRPRLRSATSSRHALQTGRSAHPLNSLGTSCNADPGVSTVLARSGALTIPAAHRQSGDPGRSRPTEHLPINTVSLAFGADSTSGTVGIANAP